MSLAKLAQAISLLFAHAHAHPEEFERERERGSEVGEEHEGVLLILREGGRRRLLVESAGCERYGLACGAYQTVAVAVLLPLSSLSSLPSR